MIKKKNAIIIFGGRFQLFFENSPFNDREGNKELNVEFINQNKFIKDDGTTDIKNSFKDYVEKISKKNKIILIYPFPENAYHVPRKLFKSYFIGKNIKSSENFLTTSYEVYLERSKSSYSLLNSIDGKNIFRVYPHEVFCNTIINNRCITHDANNLFYEDSNHLSISGAKNFNNILINKINEIN